MAFSSNLFLFLFLPATVLLYFITAKISERIIYRNLVLLITSLFFYAWGEPIFVFVICGVILLNRFLALKIDSAQNKHAKKNLLTVCVLFDIAFFFSFEYLSFVLKNLGLLFGGEINFRLPVPIGISFIIFQILSYVFDVYYGKIRAEKKVLSLMLYILLFPQLIAGPIVRYETVAKDIECRTQTREDFSKGVTRFVFGLGKKVLLSNYLAVIADNAFDMPALSLSAAGAWLGIIAYTLQIYFDFSGYSDMALGLGRIFGFHFDENFNYPYIAKSITDFWRRWHISLSSWFRDYVYIPMGGNRVSTARCILNIGVVWTLTGIWHGAEWTFLAWGVYWFILLIFEKYSGFLNWLKTSRFSFVGHIYAMFAVILGWVFFRAENLDYAVKYIGAMFGAGGSLYDATFLFNIKNGGLLILISVLFCFPVGRFIKEKLKLKNDDITAYPIGDLYIAIAALAVFVFSLASVVSSSNNPFIYFNF